MMWAAWFLGVLICLHVYQRLISRRSRRMLANLPSFATLPFIGNMHKLIGIRKNLHPVYADISKIIEDTNMPFVIWIGNTPIVVVSDPDDMRAVSISNLGKSYIYGFAEEFLGDGLISAPGAIWKQNIKKLGVAFKQSNVDAFQEIFNKQARQWVKSIRAEVDGAPFEMLHKYLYMATLMAIAESALGVSIDGDAIDEKFSKDFLRILEIIVYRLTNVHLHYKPVFCLTPVYREYKKCVKTVNDMTEKILRQRIHNMESREKYDLGKTSMKSFLEILLEMRKTNPTLTEKQIKYEVTTILMAGHETVATALNFILLAIGCRADVQRKMFDEISHVFGEAGQDVSKEDLARLCYCEAVIYETLRLYPPVPGCLREVDHNVQLKSCVLPMGTICGFNLYGSGRSRRIWGPDASEYRPERWLDPSTAAKSVSAFIGFSNGKRVCIDKSSRDEWVTKLWVSTIRTVLSTPISNYSLSYVLIESLLLGKRYALNLLKTMLVHFLTDYEVSSDTDKMTFQIDILLKPINGGLIRIRRRQRELIV